jgi:hypothetical protein
MTPTSSIPQGTHKPVEKAFAPRVAQIDERRTSSEPPRLASDELRQTLLKAVTVNHAHKVLPLGNFEHQISRQVLEGRLPAEQIPVPTIYANEWGATRSRLYLDVPQPSLRGNAKKMDWVAGRIPAGPQGCRDLCL